MNVKIKNDAGFTLLELLLVVGLMTSLVIGFGRLSTLWANRELAELSGVHMQKITEIAENYVRTNAPAAVFVDGFNDITGDVDALLPTGLTMLNPLRREVFVALNVTPLPDREYQILLYTDGDAVPYSRLLPAARASGSAGGLITGLAALNVANQAKSAFGLWEVNNIDVATTFNATPTVTADGGQLVSYLVISLEEAFGAYLYRDDMTAIGRPDLNTMFTNLNMNGNAVRAAGLVQTDNMEVHDTATIDGLTVNGATNFAGSVDITGTATVADQLSVTNDVTVSNGITVNSGNIIADTVNVNTVSATTVDTNNITATGLTVNASTVLNGDLSVTGAVDMVISGELQADDLNANTLTTTGGIATNQMTVNNNVTVTGDVEIEGSAVMDVLAVEDCLTINPSGLDEQYGLNC